MAKFTDEDVIIEDDIPYNVSKSDVGEFWFYNKNLHRVKGPAANYPDGRKIWWFHGKIHRLDGPAIDYQNEKSWYYQGKKIPCSSQEEFERLLRLKVFW